MPRPGRLGAAVHSNHFSVGSLVPWVQAGVGAVATQAAGVAGYGQRALEALQHGAAPEQALERLLADDPRRETRQLGIVAADGRAAAFTGERCLDWGGHLTGAGFAVQGNILTGPRVVDEMARAYEETGDRWPRGWSRCSRQDGVLAATGAASSLRRS